MCFLFFFLLGIGGFTLTRIQASVKPSTTEGLLPSWIAVYIWRRCSTILYLFSGHVLPADALSWLVDKSLDQTPQRWNKHQKQTADGQGEMNGDAMQPVSCFEVFRPRKPWSIELTLSAGDLVQKAPGSRDYSLVCHARERSGYDSQVRQ